MLNKNVCPKDTFLLFSLWGQIHMEMSIGVRFRIGEVQNKKMEENEKDAEGVHCIRVSVLIRLLLVSVY